MPLTPTPATVRLELDSRPDSLPCVRAMLSGAGESVGLGGELLDDLRTAVSEACSNVVLHAYGGMPGPLLVDVDLEADGVRATVSDHGAGLRSLDANQDRMRVGIPLISALADQAEFWSAPGAGTEVRMAFAGRPAGSKSGPWLRANRVSRADPPRVALSGDVVVFLSPSSLLGGVLGRVCSALAVRARFTLDRHSDLGLVTEAIAARVGARAPGGSVGFSVTALDRRLELTIGALPTGADAGSGAEPEFSPLELLADRLEVEPVCDGEILHVLMLDGRPRAERESVARLPKGETAGRLNARR